jgi:hypothetical protein
VIVYPSLPSGHTAFCDDVRQEVSGKQTLVGVYGPIMFVSEIPTTLPQIFCVITYREAPDVFGEVAIRVIHEVGDEETVMTEINLDIAKDDLPPPPPETAEPFLMREAKFVVPISPFNVKGPGHLKVRAFRGDVEIRLGALKILQAPGSDPESHIEGE